MERGMWEGEEGREKEGERGNRLEDSLGLECS